MKARSRILVLSRIASFSLAHYVGDHPVSLVGTRWQSVRIPAEGSLVALQCARESKWYISWVIKVEDADHVLLESIDDGELCWWGNVSFLQYEGETPQSWRWTDRQHELNDRWMNACYKKRDAYIHRPNTLVFDGNKVTCTLRTAFGIDKHTMSHVFLDWDKTPSISQRAMLEFYDMAIKNWPKS
jgi:hypothetical protein